MRADQHTYPVKWSAEDGEYVGFAPLNCARVLP
jgi:hypothetical protein